MNKHIKGFKGRYIRRAETHKIITKFDSSVIATYITLFSVLGIIAMSTSIALVFREIMHNYG